MIQRKSLLSIYGNRKTIQVWPLLGVLAREEEGEEEEEEEVEEGEKVKSKWRGKEEEEDKGPEEPLLWRTDKAHVAHVLIEGKKQQVLTQKYLYLRIGKELRIEICNVACITRHCPHTVEVWDLN